MTDRSKWKLRVIRPGDRQPKEADYWRTRPLAERLAAMLELHRQGNDLFLGGHPKFVFELRVRNVGHQ